MLTLTGCATTQKNTSLVNVPFPTPLQSDIRLERQVATLTLGLQRQEMTREQAAQLYFDRGATYEALGMSYLAIMDIDVALKLKPDLAEAYNYQGIYSTLHMQYDKAYESFDNVLELNPEHEYAYLNRGIALYYGGRANHAVDDLSAFLQRKPDDAYRIIWVYLAERKVDEQKAAQTMRQLMQNVDKNDWAYKLLAYHLGEVSQQEVLKSAEQTSDNYRQFVERLCEAYFYFGKEASRLGDNARAEEFFNLALATNVYEFVEHKYARLELRLLYQDEQEIAN